MKKEEVHLNFNTSANFITEFMHKTLKDAGVSEAWVSIVNLLILLAASIIIIIILHRSIRYILTFAFKKAEKVTHQSFFKHAIRNKVPDYLGLIVPYTFITNSISTIFADYPESIPFWSKLTDIFMVFVTIWTIMSVVRSLANVINEKPAFHNKPLKSYLQVIQIIIYIFGAVVIFSIITGKSVGTFFAAMGAASAILLLMFKDTIMGFVSSILISTNQMVMIGDWIQLDKYGADGTVEEINLTTVKVRNFDKTITTIPTYFLISDSFQNWRGMQESGGRRIKQSVYIKQSGIRNLTDEELDEFEKMPPLSQYIKDKRSEYKTLNENLQLDPNSPLKGSQITNCHLYMQYATWYLRNNPKIRQDMTLMVRQLAPTTQGLPIQVYVFTDTVIWTEYEGIMAEVFSHLIVAVNTFGLTIFELPAGTDQFNIALDKETSNSK